MAARVRVAVIYNEPTLPVDHPDAASERGVVAVSVAIAGALKRRGFKAFRMGARPPLGRFLKRLERQKPDVVFNLVEGFGGDSEGEARWAALLELLNVTYTGCPPLAMSICRSKATAKAILRGHGLPTADWWTIAPGGPIPDDLATRDFAARPVLVKPEAEDASLGLDQSSVIRRLEDLGPAVDRLSLAFGGSALVEAYLPGPEFNVGVLEDENGPVALPVAEVLFQPRDGQWPILTYQAKWCPGSDEDQASPVRCPAEIASGLAEQLRALAVRAFQAMHARDVCRVDFRLDGDGRPMILEVNPNPDLDPSAGLARAIQADGRNYDDVIVHMVERAIQRAEAMKGRDQSAPKST